jgi:hypothetical protein
LTRRSWLCAASGTAARTLSAAKVVMRVVKECNMDFLLKLWKVALASASSGVIGLDIHLVAPRVPGYVYFAHKCKSLIFNDFF